VAQSLFVKATLGWGLNMNWTRLSAAALGALALASSANATEFLLTYTGGGFDVSATIQATPDGGNQYTATSATGLIDGMALTLGAPGSCCGIPAADNFLFTSGSPLDLGGIAFDAGGVGYNLFIGNPSILDSNFVFDGNGGTVTLTQVPEPATWTLLLVGIGGLGAAMRSVRRKTVAARA
jgi:hypothetical protein